MILARKTALLHASTKFVRGNARQPMFKRVRPFLAGSNASAGPGLERNGEHEPFSECLISDSTICIAFGTVEGKPYQTLGSTLFLRATAKNP
jgi:hypothetical protein